MSKMVESAVMLGPDKALVGIVTPPSGDGAGSAGSGKPAVVILNSGIVHRVGANRMSVLLARALAAQGHLVLRFDLAGHGDSESRKVPLPPFESVVADLRDVLDSLEQTRQVRKVLLMGMCSGANHSIGYAHLDPRVAGVALIDPSVPRTRGYFLRHGLKRARDPRSWADLLSGKPEKWRSLRETTRLSRLQAGAPADEQRAAGDDAAPLTVDDPQVVAWLENVYARAVASDVQILSVFTGGLPSRLNYREQILDAFPSVPFGSRLRLEYRDESDHEFTLESDRNWLIGTILEWTHRTAFTRQEAAA